MSAKLKPCPFCGSKEIVRNSEDGRSWNVCLGCNATGPVTSKYDDEDAIDWNSRQLVERDAQAAPAVPVAVAKVGKGQVASFVHLTDAGRALPVGKYDLYLGQVVPDTDRKDAARYRWLRHGDNCEAAELVSRLWDEKLDAAIDAAIAAQKGPTND